MWRLILILTVANAFLIPFCWAEEENNNTNCNEPLPLFKPIRNMLNKFLIWISNFDMCNTVEKTFTVLDTILHVHPLGEQGPVLPFIKVFIGCRKSS